MNKFGKIAITVIIIILISAFGAYGVLYAFAGKKIPLIDKIITVPYSEKKSQQAMAGMYEKLKNNKTARYQLNANYKNIVGQVPVELKTYAVLEGGFDEKFRGNFLVENELKLPNTIINVDITSVFTKDKTFFKITRIPAIPVTDFEVIKDIWYEVDQADSASEFNLAFLDAGLFKFNQRFTDKLINNKLSYHYSVRLSEDAMVSLLSVIPNFDKLFNIYNSEIANWQIELWIGKEELNLNKITGVYKENDTLANFSIVIDNFNKTIKLEYPSFGRSTNSFYQDIFNETNLLDLPLFGYLADIKTDSITEDNDNDGLFDVWENIFKTDPQQADTDHDGFNDGMEIRNGYNPLGGGELKIFNP